MTPLGRRSSLLYPRPTDREQTNERIAYDADGNPFLSDAQRAATARKIIEVAARARGEITDDPAPLSDAAASIAAAGRRRRGGW